MIFPVLGPVEYQSHFTSEHRGIDIFAPMGAKVVAVERGRARKDDDPRGGLVIYLDGNSGKSYYYAHLSGLEGSFPRDVEAGEVIGYVGDSGNAAGKDPHLHFQVKLTSGDTIDPYPLLSTKEKKRSWLPTVAFVLLGFGGVLTFGKKRPGKR